MKRDGTKIFETKKLELRELVSDDATGLSTILSDPETMQYYPRPYTLEETRGWIKRSVKSLILCFIVILAKAGIQLYHKLMDSRLRGNDRI